MYSACLLGNHHIPVAYDVNSDPLFYVEVNDIDTMQVLSKYVACTSEKIFASKKALFDVFVDRQEIQPSERYAQVCRINSADHAKYRVLETAMSAQTGGEADKAAREYFETLTTTIFATLSAASISVAREITPEHFREMALDPSEDQWFVGRLISLYDMDVTLPKPKEGFDLCDCCCGHAEGYYEIES